MPEAGAVVLVQACLGPGRGSCGGVIQDTLLHKLRKLSHLLRPMKLALAPN